MNPVAFPALGLDFQINPVAFSLGSWHIYWYGIIIALGFLLGVAFCNGHTRHFALRSDDLMDMLLVATPLSIVGARTYYVLFYLDLFRRADGTLDVAKMFQIHDGGIAIYGAVIFAVLGAYLLCRHKNISFASMADLACFGLLIGQCIGRWGNFVNSEAYGGETSLPWRMRILENGQFLEVHPTFLYESLWNLLGFLLLYWLLRKGIRPFAGMYFTLYLAWYGLGRGFIEGLRTDSLYLFETGLRVSQCLGFASCILALAYLAYRLHKNKMPKNIP